MVVQRSHGGEASSDLAECEDSTTQRLLYMIKRNLFLAPKINRTVPANAGSLARSTRVE